MTTGTTVKVAANVDSAPPALRHPSTAKGARQRQSVIPVTRIGRLGRQSEAGVNRAGVRRLEREWAGMAAGGRGQ